MKNSQSEFLSAFLDDEAGAFERRRIMDELKQDNELATQLSRYAFIKEAMRAHQKDVVIAPDHFLQGIHAKIAESEQANDAIVIQRDESMPMHTSTKQPWRQWMQYSIAAGFGAVTMAVVLTQMSTTTKHTATKTTNIATAHSVESKEESIIKGDSIALSHPRPISRLDPKTQAVLKEYITEHIRYASTTTVVPTIRAVSYNNTSYNAKSPLK